MSGTRRADTSIARAFDRAAGIYEQARPGWPPQALDHAVRELGLDEAATVLDLGAGTGKLTRMLVERFERVLAVEPLDGMRAQLESLVPLAEALSGSAECIPIAGDSIDAVFCAEAFHWFDGVRALAEITRVLRPRGGLVLMWNAVARPTDPSVAAAALVLDQRGHPERQVRRYTSGEWLGAFADASFEPLREASFENTQVTDQEGLLAYWQSMSWIAALPERDQADLLREVHGLLEADTYTRFWRTDAYWTRLRV